MHVREFWFIDLLFMQNIQAFRFLICQSDSFAGEVGFRFEIQQQWEITALSPYSAVTSPFPETVESWPSNREENGGKAPR